MGMRKSGWFNGMVLLVFVVGFTFAGIFLLHYLKAKAAVNETGNHLKNESSILSAEELRKAVSDAKLEKELLATEQRKAEESYRQLAENKMKNTPQKSPGTAVKPQKQPAKPPQKPKPVQPSQSGKKTIYLTFDDGPQSYSKDIIALLEKYHYKATFFMLQPNIKKYPDSVKLMVKMGEQIGSHGVTHNRKLFYASSVSVVGEMDQTRETLKAVSGIDTFLIRTPFGSAPDMKPEYKEAVFEHGYMMWDWNIDSKDWYYKDGRYVTNVIQQLNHKKNQSGPIVILLHERRETLAHLPKLLNYLSSHNYVSKVIEPAMIPFHF